MNKKVGITEVVLRDGNQSLLSTRLKLEDIIPIASKLDDIGYSSIESWGGAVFDSCVRYLDEDPWERLRELKKAMPKTKQQMLLRGQNLVGYKHYSDEIVSKFIERSIDNGIDIFRIFDALNDLRNIKHSVEIVKKNGKHAQGTIAYTISPVHTIETWIDLAKEIEDLDCSSLCIKDMSGILSPEFAFKLISQLKKEISIPIHLHTHATTGMSNLTNMRAVEAGVDNIDTSISSMSMGYGHSATETMIYLLKEKNIDVDIDLNDLLKISEYFKFIRYKYNEFEGSMKGVDLQMLINQVPGGMLSNLETQLKNLGKEELLEDVVSEIYEVRKDVGFVPLVTPASQIIGAQALSNILNERYETLSIEIIDLILGYYGKLPGVINTNLFEKALEQKNNITNRPADLLLEKFEDFRENLKQYCKKLKIKDLSSIEENILTFILIPYGSEKIFKKMSS
ncbi:pyruvate carboxylase subunit B [Gammaproteobacteria bacterium]|nr:pyruvate carboxylase subunit B [Gammaproteobacteria bacterium]